jgi:hypothetical protein
MSTSNKPGYVYCIVNKSLPGVCKIGCTTKTPEERAKSLHSSGVLYPTPFEVVYSKRVTNAFATERSIFRIIMQDLKIQRCQKNKEFFVCSPEQVKHLFVNTEVDTIQLESMEDKCATTKETTKETNTSSSTYSTFSLEENTKCSLCFKKFEKSKGLSVHMSKIHNMRGIKCICTGCAKQFRDKTDLSRHIRVCKGRLVSPTVFNITNNMNSITKKISNKVNVTNHVTDNSIKIVNGSYTNMMDINGQSKDEDVIPCHEIVNSVSHMLRYQNPRMLLKTPSEFMESLIYLFLSHTYVWVMNHELIVIKCDFRPAPKTIGKNEFVQMIKRHLREMNEFFTSLELSSNITDQETANMHYLLSWIDGTLDAPNAQVLDQLMLETMGKYQNGLRFVNIFNAQPQA